MCGSVVLILNRTIGCRSKVVPTLAHGTRRQSHYRTPSQALARSCLGWLSLGGDDPKQVFVHVTTFILLCVYVCVCVQTTDVYWKIDLKFSPIVLRSFPDLSLFKNISPFPCVHNDDKLSSSPSANHTK